MQFRSFFDIALIIQHSAPSVRSKEEVSRVEIWLRYRCYPPTIYARIVSASPTAHPNHISDAILHRLWLSNQLSLLIFEIIIEAIKSEAEWRRKNFKRFSVSFQIKWCWEEPPPIWEKIPDFPVLFLWEFPLSGKFKYVIGIYQGYLIQ